MLNENEKLNEQHPYYGIYRDDGFLVFRGHKNPVDVEHWLQRFQRSVNRSAGSDALQFTASVGSGERGELRK